MKINRTILKIAIIATALSDAGQGATTPALASIMGAFPNVSPNFIQIAINSVVALFIAITPIVYSRLVVAGFKKRNLLGVSAVLFLIGGVGPYFLHSSIWIVLVLRALLGIASGISIPLSVDLVVDYFEGKQRRTMTGFVSATTGFSGIVFQLLGGWLCGINWTYTFLAYGISIIFVIIWVIFLPEPQRAEKVQQEQQVGKADKKLYGGVFAIAGLVFFFYLLWYVLPNNGAFVLIGEGIANPAQVGVAFTAMVISSTIMSLLHGPLFRVLKFALIPAAFLVFAVGMLICYVATDYTLFTVGILLNGIGLGISIPVAMTKVTCMSSYTASPKAVSWCFVGMGLGGFFQPIIFGLFGQSSTLRPPFLIAFIGGVVFAVVAIIVNRVTASHTVVPEIMEKA